MNFKKKLLYYVGGLLLLGGLLAGCSSGQAEQGDSQIATEEAALNDNVIDVKAYEFGYTPSTVTLEKGKEYELILTNEGGIFHDLNVEGLDVEITYMSEMGEHPEEASLFDKLFGVQVVHADAGHGSEETPSIHMNVEAGQTVSIKFIAKEAGDFKIYCSVQGHEEAGMVAELEVK